MGRSTLDPDAMPIWLASIFANGWANSRVIAGVNQDDCAVIRLKKELLVISTDYLNARPIARELGIGSFRDLGRLVVGANLSDLCSTGANPVAMLIAITMERGSTSDDFKQVMRGVRAEAQRWKIPIVGGDTKLGGATSILGIAIGLADQRSNLFLRNSARPGDLLWCSGPLGSCCAAVVGLTKFKLPPAWIAWARRAIVRPELPLHLSRAVSRAKIGKAGIDISDGLGGDLARLAMASGVGITVNAVRIPVSHETQQLAERLNVAPWAFAFGIGGDLQFVVTSRFRDRARMKRLGLIEIGEVNDTCKLRMRMPSGREIPMQREGHRDARNLTFGDEAFELVRAVSTGGEKSQ